jgi:hypothetical protein
MDTYKSYIFSSYPLKNNDNNEPAFFIFFVIIGCAKYPTAEESLAKKPVYYINVCKFKIVCKTVDKVKINDINSLERF